MSVLDSQANLTKAKDKLQKALERTEEAQREVDRLTELHRAQILKSMLSKNEEERVMARGISHFWEVPIPETLALQEEGE